jgi:hypothetical protein
MARNPTIFRAHSLVGVRRPLQSLRLLSNGFYLVRSNATAFRCRRNNRVFATVDGPASGPGPLPPTSSSMEHIDEVLMCSSVDCLALRLRRPTRKRSFICIASLCRRPHRCPRKTQSAQCRGLLDLKICLRPLSMGIPSCHRRRRRRRSL